MGYRLYWGDLHNHCSISYGQGSVQQALARARAQLDFCSITGHAFWPDMPSDRSRYAEIIDYHQKGFARLARNWESLLREQASASRDGEFVVFPSYEWHSCSFGDHNLYSPIHELPLRNAADLSGLRKVAAQCRGIVIPHHIGYKAGFRGINWKHFREECTPFVEIFSLHGCSESESAPYPMLHDMGPRDAGSTAEAGWALGHRFGVVASTDHHAAFPGSHGDGRMGVFARKCSRESLWEAFLSRRVFAVTGDKIDARLFLDGAWIGESISAPHRRHLQVHVRGSDTLDRVEVLKNGKVRWRFHPRMDGTCSGVGRLRLTWGWGQWNKKINWSAKLKLSDGVIRGIETCFSGQPIVSPQEKVSSIDKEKDIDFPHAVVAHDKRWVEWRSITAGNLTMRHPCLQALSIELDGPKDAHVCVEINGQVFRHALAELFRAGNTHFLRGWLSEAIRIGPFVPASDYTVIEEFQDDPEFDVDIYRLRAAQANGQWVWLTPIWVSKT